MLVIKVLRNRVIKNHLLLNATLLNKHSGPILIKVVLYSGSCVILLPQILRIREAGLFLITVDHFGLGELSRRTTELWQLQQHPENIIIQNAKNAASSLSVVNP